MKPYSPESLTAEQLELCYKTVSPSVFYTIVWNALTTGSPLSVVRMGDGERSLLLSCAESDPNAIIQGGEWYRKLGLLGITKAELQKRILLAESSCSHFAPSITGIVDQRFNLYDLFPQRKHYIDNFFVNSWNDAEKIALFKKAGRVLLIHHNPHTADSLQLRVQGNLGVEVSYLKMSSWEQTEDVANKAMRMDAPLVLVSAGPAGKYIIPKMANNYFNKVVLDIGNSADQWTITSLPINRKAAEEFHRVKYGK